MESDDELVDGAAPTLKRRRLAREDGLQKALASGLYPEFLGVAGPVNRMDPSCDSMLDFLKLLWPDCLCEHIAGETNEYATQVKAKNWVDTSEEEVWVFLGIVMEMGIHRVPKIVNYWSRNPLLGIVPVKQAMSLNRFKALWRYLHCDDNKGITDSRDIASKVKTVVEVLGHTFLANYHPSQELSVDEMMVKYKGRKGGKIRMPNKPVKLGFKVWSCSCSCCGYLCTFQLYSGRRTDSSGRKVTEKGLKTRVVTELVEPFKNSNHVVYLDNYYTSGPLIDTLAKDQIYVVGTIQQRAKGFPVSLKGIKLAKGEYSATTVGDIRYFAFRDRKVVSFATNVFPETMSDTVVRLQSDGTLKHQSVPPLLPAYNKYMGGVDRTGQMRKVYGYDRKSKRYWLRLFFHLLDVAIGNSYQLYRHECERLGMRPVSHMEFRLELIEKLLAVSKRKYCSGYDSRIVDSCVGVCQLVGIEAVQLKRGRCHLCVREKKRSEQRHTVYACSVCRVRLCKSDCFVRHHQDKD